MRRTPKRVTDPKVLARFESELSVVEECARGLRHLVGRHVTVDDLVSFGQEGLWRAARTFDHAQGVPFRCWARVRVRGAMIDGARQWGIPRTALAQMAADAAGDASAATPAARSKARPTTKPRAMRAGSRRSDQATPRRAVDEARVGLRWDALKFAAAAVDANAVVDGAATPEDLAAERELVQLVRDAVAKLPAKERKLFESCDLQGLLLSQFARSHKMSKTSATQLHARGLERLARILRELGLSHVGAGARGTGSQGKVRTTVVHALSPATAPVAAAEAASAAMCRRARTSLLRGARFGAGRSVARRAPEGPAVFVVEPLGAEGVARWSAFAVDALGEAPAAAPRAMRRRRSRSAGRCAARRAARAAVLGSAVKDRGRALDPSRGRDRAGRGRAARAGPASHVVTQWARDGSGVRDGPARPVHRAAVRGRGTADGAPFHASEFSW